MPLGPLARIAVADLLRLAELAADAEAELFERHTRRSGRYAGPPAGRALCLGAALHYVDNTNGVKDFDVWSFYAKHDWPFPAWWHARRDFGLSKFSRYPVTRHITRAGVSTFFRRSLLAAPGTDPADAIRRYLTT